MSIPRQWAWGTLGGFPGTNNFYTPAFGVTKSIYVWSICCTMRGSVDNNMPAAGAAIPAVRFTCTVGTTGANIYTFSGAANVFSVCRVNQTILLGGAEYQFLTTDSLTFTTSAAALHGGVVALDYVTIGVEFDVT